MTRSSYNATLQAVNGSDSAIVVPAANARETSQVEAATQAVTVFPNCHFGNLNCYSS
jgi:hypothetical protein